MKFIKPYKLFEHADPDWSILDDLVFQHQTRKDLDVLSPQTYDEIARERKNPDYIESRIETEKEYHEYIGDDSDPSKSFVYATIVGYNKMDDFPGNTYYFKLDKEQISKCLFMVGDYGPVLGIVGLHGSLNYWKENVDSLTDFEDENIGTIQPRIEVIIPFDVENIYKKYE